MGDLEPLVVDLFVTIEKDIEVNVTRALIDDLLASHVVLDGLKLIQQSYRVKICLDLVIGQQDASQMFFDIHASQAPLTKRS
jgi:hypothetical protein